MDWVRSHVTHCVLGNHDHFVLHGCPPGCPDAVRFGVDLAVASLDTEHARWLAQLPLTWQGTLDGCSMLLVHGSPWNPLDDYLYADHPRLAELDAIAEFQVIAFGQTHRFLERRASGRLRVNPGSIGQSRDPETRGCACAAIVDTHTMDLTRVIRPYDVSEVCHRAVARGAGDWIRKHLLQ
jgi:predicted phosphodiesterase